MGMGFMLDLKTQTALKHVQNIFYVIFNKKFRAKSVCKKSLTYKNKANTLRPKQMKKLLEVL